MGALFAIPLPRADTGFGADGLGSPTEEKAPMA